MECMIGKTYYFYLLFLCFSVPRVRGFLIKIGFRMLKNFEEEVVGMKDKTTDNRKAKDQTIHFPRQKFENMSESEFHAILKRLIDHIVDDIDNPIPIHIQLIKALRWPTESLRKRFLRRQVKGSVMRFIEKEVEKINRTTKRK